MEHADPRIDAVIAKSADFAKPILIHLRRLVHQACPDIMETIKWGMPFFDYKGTVCYMAAFKQHCAFGFWKTGMLNDEYKVLKLGDEKSSGSFGRITSIYDLPSDEVLIAYIKQAVALNENNIKKPARPRPVVDQDSISVPADFKQLLEDNTAAQEHFDKFSLSKQKEYIAWFAEAKTDTTRQKRMEQALEWISEGKSRNWKYQTR